MARTPDETLVAWLAEHGHGEVEAAVPLKGDLGATEEGATPVWLLLTPRSLLLAARSAAGVTVVDVLDAYPTGYESRVLGDRLTVGLHVLGVPVGRGAEVRRLVGVARLRERGLAARLDPPVPAGPWVEGVRPIDATWLDASLGAGERLLAWLPTRAAAPLRSPFLREPDEDWRLFLTSDRAWLVALSETGDVLDRPLEARPIEVEERFGRTVVRLGGAEWSIPLGRGGAWKQVADLPALGREDRLRAAAERVAAEAPETARGLLLDVVDGGDPLDRLTLGLVSAADEASWPDPGAREALARLVAEEPDASRLVAWLSRWRLDADRARALLAAVLEALPGPDETGWAVPLHRAVRDLVVADADPTAAAEADLALAEHLLIAARTAEARALVEPLLDRLPDESLDEVAPPEGADLVAGEGVRPLRVAALEILAAAREGGPDPATLAALARCQPLVPERLAALAEHGAPELRERAATAAAALDAGGLDEPGAGEPLAEVHPLPEADLERLRHPVARKDGAFGRIAAFLARVEPPDHGIVRAYCERLLPERWPEAARALADAAVLLGMPAPPAFVSRGERQVGLRAHEVPEPFLLVGGAHLDPGSPFHLDPLELRFAIAAELAHLRFQHGRFTAHDVWLGTWDKGQAAAGALAAFLPFLKYLPTPARAASSGLGAILPASWADKLPLANTAARRIAGGNAARTDLGDDASRLLAAHRVLQLTADRAGLVLAGDLRAALRAMLRQSERLQAEWPVIRERGLRGALGRRDPAGKPLWPHLAARVAALVSFWLSEDYAALRRRAAGG